MIKIIIELTLTICNYITVEQKSDPGSEEVIEFDFLSLICRVHKKKFSRVVLFVMEEQAGCTSGVNVLFS